MSLKSITSLSLGLVVAAFAAIAVSLVSAAAASAQGSNEKKESAPKNSGVSYIYVAQPGDSYSEMARKAVQTYGKKHKVNLSLGQILYAETNLTQEAGSPFLIQGQTVTIQESAVKNWIEKARKLSDGEVAAWNAYTAGVDFNTDDVGQSS